MRIVNVSVRALPRGDCVRPQRPQRMGSTAWHAIIVDGYLALRCCLLTDSSRFSIGFAWYLSWATNISSTESLSCWRHRLFMGQSISFSSQNVVVRFFFGFFVGLDRVLLIFPILEFTSFGVAFTDHRLMWKRALTWIYLCVFVNTLSLFSFFLFCWRFRWQFFVVVVHYVCVD